MLYRSLNQLKNSQKTVEVLLNSGHCSFKGKVVDIDKDYILMSILYNYSDEDHPTWHEVIIKLSFISSIVYEKELSDFISEDKQKEYEEEFKKQS